tara:strand:+ start:249 stop:455 length:207 start_codon:yes stop_codon:yes gene_type:complete
MEYALVIFKRLSPYAPIAIGKYLLRFLLYFMPNKFARFTIFSKPNWYAILRGTIFDEFLKDSINVDFP